RRQLPLHCGYLTFIPLHMQTHELVQCLICRLASAHFFHCLDFLLQGTHRDACLPLIQLPGDITSFGLPLVIFQEAPKPFATPNEASMGCAPADSRKEQDIPFPLMSSLVMIMFYVLIERTTQGCFSKQDQACETLLLDGSDPSLRIGVQIRRSGWQGHPLDTSIIDDVLKCRTEIRVSVMDEILAR